MPLNTKQANEILYVPFSNEYLCSDRIKKELTEEEFFKRCMVHTDFDKRKKQLQSLPEENLDNIDPEGLLDVSEELKRLDKFINDEQRFLDWIESGNNKVFIISGTAGSGKTTYLNYMRYEGKKDNIIWDIINMDTVGKRILIYDRYFNYPSIENTYQKICAILMQKICFFVFNFEHEEQFSERIKKILDKITKKDNKSMLAITKQFFHILADCLDERDSIQVASEKIFHFFNELSQSSVDMTELLDIYIFLLYFYYKSYCKIIIVLDNIEKFIKTDQVYDSEIVNLKSVIDRYLEDKEKMFSDFPLIFQFIMGIRDTTLKMIDEYSHGKDFVNDFIDMSEWIPLGEVISKKLQWYEKHNIDTDIKILEMVLQDNAKIKIESYTKITGANRRIGMLLNYNKRLMTDLLVEIIKSSAYSNEIKKYQEYMGMNRPITRYAARSIIIGLVLFELQDRGFFKDIKAIGEDSDHILGMGYARKILTILYNYKNSIYNNTQDFRSCDLLLKEFYNRDDIEDFEIEKFAKTLQSMNSFNRVNGYWFQFIDLQLEGINRNIQMTDNNIKHLLTANREKLKVRIMPAGVCYLLYIVQSFDYFVCRYCSKERPILCYIPPYENLKSQNDIEKLPCVIIMNKILRQTKECIKVLTKNDTDYCTVGEKINYDILYRCGEWKSGTLYKEKGNDIVHSIRIINSHIGTIDNFLNCAKLIYGEKIKEDKNGWMLLEDCLYSIKRKYRDVLFDLKRIVGTNGSKYIRYR